MNNGTFLTHEHTSSTNSKERGMVSELTKCSHTYYTVPAN